MRHVRNPQMELGEIGIEDIWIDLKSRDDIPALLLGLQHLYADEETRTRLFALLEEQMLPGVDRTVGRPGMEMWMILVMVVVMQGLVYQANWQKAGGASPPERRSNQTTFLRKPCVGSREGAGEASAAVRMGRAMEHRKAMVRGAEAFRSVEGNIAGIVMVRCRRVPRCRRTHARSHAFCRDPGRSSNCP